MHARGSGLDIYSRFNASYRSSILLLCMDFHVFLVEMAIFIFDLMTVVIDSGFGGLLASDALDVSLV